MAPSVWAQAKQLSDATNAPPPPDVWATPLDPQGAAIAAALPAKAPPSVWAPVDQLSGPVAPKVELAPQPQSPLQKVLEHQTSKLWADYDKDANPMGSANNHPGFWGKLAHGLNVAMGGVNRRGWEENGLVKNIDTTLQDQSQNDLRGAQAKNFATEDTLAPGKAASEEGLQGAQAGEANARAYALENPPASTPELGTYRSLVALGMSPSDALKEIERDKALGLMPKGMEHVDIVGTDGKPIQASYNPITGQTTDASGNVIPNPQPYEKPNQAGMVTLIAPDPNTPGGGIVERLGAGAKVAPGAQTTAGFNTMNTPTTNQRTAAGRAATVLAMVPEVTSRIDSVSSQLGPEMGRWNDFMQGKIGTDNPQFAALRSDLLMMSSAVALAHAQGRLPENLREEFDKAINAPKQTPENLKATINAMVPWLQKVQSQGERTGTQGQNGAPKEGDIKTNGAGDKIKFSGGKWVAQ